MVTTSTATQTGEPTPVSPVTDTWLVIPLYNEATVVREVISQARKIFPYVVVVDDGSKDASAQEAAAAGAVVVRHPVNLGQGAALQTGFSYVLEKTNADYIVTFDADGQHSTTDAAAMVAAARDEGLAVVLGSRFLEGPSPVGWLKRVVLRTAAAVSSHTSGMRLTDAHNGLRALNRKAASSIEINQNRMAHASEITGEIARHRLAYAEEPVYILYTDYSRAKGQSVWNMVNILSDLTFK